MDQHRSLYLEDVLTARLRIVSTIQEVDMKATRLTISVLAFFASAGAQGQVSRQAAPGTFADPPPRGSVYTPPGVPTMRSTPRPILNRTDPQLKRGSSPATSGLYRSSPQRLRDSSREINSYLKNNTKGRSR